MTLNDSVAVRKQSRRTTPSSLLTYQELAVWLNDSVRHLRRLVDEKQIPYLKIGRFVRFDEREITEWLNANRHTRCADLTRSKIAHRSRRS
jgi:excisionase family DNA binding protein